LIDWNSLAMLLDPLYGPRDALNGFSVELADPDLQLLRVASSRRAACAGP